MFPTHVTKRLAGSSRSISEEAQPKEEGQRHEGWKGKEVRVAYHERKRLSPILTFGCASAEHLRCGVFSKGSIANSERCSWSHCPWSVVSFRGGRKKMPYGLFLAGNFLHEHTAKRVGRCTPALPPCVRSSGVLASTLHHATRTAVWTAKSNSPA